MAFSTISDFLNMDGHGLYVWLCYGMGIVLFIVIYYQSFSQRKSVLRELAQRYRRQQINANNKQQTEN